MSESSPPKSELKRSLGLTLLTFYGVGTIVGGGFYALIGEVADKAGMRAPWSFLGAAVIAMFSGYSFAQLSRRFPVSAGEAHYVREAFGKNWLAAIVGWMVIITGVVSAATLTRAFAGFAGTISSIPGWISMLVLVTALCFIACRGIGESAWAATGITLIELGGLVAVFVAGASNLPSLGDRWPELAPTMNIEVWSGILVGAYLAFYAFIGFEDLVNVAEEVKDPGRTLPAAIWLSMIISSLFYFCVAIVLILSVPMAELTQSDSPLSLIFGDNQTAVTAITLVGMLAGINGALIQIIMASRVGYGLAGQQLSPKFMRAIHPKWKTPVWSTITFSGIVLVLAWWIPLAGLAQITTTVLLGVFALVNIALIVIRMREHRSGELALSFSIVIPVVGVLLCSIFVIVRAVAIF